MTDIARPLTITGPATENILTQSPKIIPSFLNSMAGLVIELENPVIGTIETKKAKTPILSYTPTAVRKLARKIRIINIHVPALSILIVGKIASSES